MKTPGKPGDPPANFEILMAALYKVRSDVPALSKNAQLERLGFKVKNAPDAAEVISESH